ncbi:MAG: PLP-dependent aspartate aminotransferase family protein [Halolamina sp.]|uniref:trans-sulfuration enzyme family protein n=1 Tax=Halolamina sp. TaxID=1940283 RepID=UPI002FC356C1
MGDRDDHRFATRAVSWGEDPASSEVGDVVSPIHLSSTYAVPGIDEEFKLDEADPDAGEFLYGRLSNPTRHAAEKRLAALEDGAHGLAFASGTAAISTLFFATLTPGDHVVAFDDLYAGTRRMLETLFRDRLTVDVSFVDATDAGNVADAMRRETALVYMETPTNPLLRCCDLAAIADVADAGDALLAVDNTFPSPFLQRPLELGADIVAHSTTKYLNGHSDSIGGALVLDDDDLAAECYHLQRVLLGNTMAPFDAYLTLRGMKTLPMRMRQHEANAREIARFLDEHPKVETVHYPGLESHPQHELASQQMAGYGGMLSFELDGDMDDAAAFLEALTTFTLAVSLGGVESLVELPAGMTHEPIPKAEREKLGITDTLVRMSVGVEAVEDLLADLERGFAAMGEFAEHRPSADD